MIDTLFPTAITLSQNPLPICPGFSPRVSKSYFNFQFLFPPGNSITGATIESTLLEMIQREEMMTKHWDCKLVFKEEQDGP
jgi:hypothetical protein